MTRDPARLTDQTFDLLIIGGGIVGAGIARDAAQRGFSCALVEAGDFASGTSSKTTKLIHGGLRYLEQLDFPLVRESLRERELLLKLAPRLVQPLPFLIPVVGNSPRPWPLVRLGALLYDWLAGKSSVGKHRVLRGSKLHQAEPLLQKSSAQRAVLYSDAQMDDTRLVLSTILAAADEGAVVLNYMKVVEWRSEAGRLTGAKVEDQLSGQRHAIQAKRIVNATGPWADRLRQMADPNLSPIVRPSKGIHLVYPDVGLRHALVLASESDQRIFFLIPWRGLTLIGTTDTDYSGDPGAVQATSEEVEYLIRETNRLLPQLRLERERIISTFAGVRPLAAQEHKDPWAVSRTHLIHEDSNGMVTIVGGKFTTFRKIAEDVVDWLARKFREKKLNPCKTAQSPIGPASGTWRSEEMKELLQSLLQYAQIYPSEVSRLVQRYGAGARTILQWIRQDPRWAKPLCPHHPFTRGEVRYAVEEEMALSLSDLLWRRLQIGWSLCQGLDCLEACAEIMQEALGWSADEQHQKIEQYREEMASAHRSLQS